MKRYPVLTSFALMVAAFALTLGGIVLAGGCATNPSSDNPPSAPPATGTRNAVLTGMGRVDPGVYGQPYPLAGPRIDIERMRGLAESLHYNVVVLADAGATRQAHVQNWWWAVKDLGPGDRAFIYFSGHGTQKPDASGDEPDQLDEAILAYDGLITDDGVREFLEVVPAGVWVYMSFDSCHSGTMERTRAVIRWLTRNWAFKLTPYVPKIPKALGCTVMVMSGCESGAYSYESAGKGGHFTKAKSDLHDWQITNREWADRVTAEMGATQPCVFVIEGPDAELMWNSPALQ